MASALRTMAKGQARALGLKLLAPHWSGDLEELSVALDRALDGAELVLPHGLVLTPSFRPIDKGLRAIVTIGECLAWRQMGGRGRPYIRLGWSAWPHCHSPSIGRVHRSWPQVRSAWSNSTDFTDNEQDWQSPGGWHVQFRLWARYHPKTAGIGCVDKYGRKPWQQLASRARTWLEQNWELFGDG